MPVRDMLLPLYVRGKRLRKDEKCAKCNTSSTWWSPGWSISETHDALSCLRPTQGSATGVSMAHEKQALLLGEDLRSI